MSKCSNGKRAYLRCKLYADSGKQKLCTRHSVRLDQLIDLVSDRIRYYVQTYYELDAADIQPQKDTRREALEQEQIPLADAEVTMLPQTYVALSEEADLNNIRKILDLLDADDDVQEVFHNWEE